MSDSGRTGIAAAGNWIVDHVKVIDTYPRQDTLANIDLLPSCLAAGEELGFRPL